MSFVSESDSRRRVLDASHGPWRPRTLPAVLDAVAARYPDRPFVITENLTLSYAQFAEEAASLARGLVARGIAPGDRVALILPNGQEMVAAKVAVARAGAVAVPVNFRLHASELGQVLALAHVTGVITMERFREVDALDALDRICPGWDTPAGQRDLPGLRLIVTVPEDGGEPRRPGAPSLADLRLAPRADLDAVIADRMGATSPHDLATIFYTSGTTGVPKGVLSTHDMELRSAYGSAYTRAFDDGWRIMFALPLNHVFAYVEGLLSVIFAAGSVVVQPVFDPRASLEAIERYQVNEALFVPTMSLAVVEAARASRHDLSSLRSVMSAAQSAPASLWNDLADLLGAEQIVTAYGMTETSAATTFTRPGGPVEDLVRTVGWPKPGGVAGDPELGGALAQYKTVDRFTGADLPPGAEGELAARGPIVSGGYFGQPEETAAAMLPGGWLRSGDLGYMRDDGALVLTGRAKDIYKCGAELVMPTEVEACLTRHPAITQAYVVGVPDPRMGEVGCAWVVPEPGAAVGADEVISYCRAELARFKVPAYVFFCAAGELPLTVSGKVQKFKLAERAEARLQG